MPNSKETKAEPPKTEDRPDVNLSCYVKAEFADIVDAIAKADNERPRAAMLRILLQEAIDKRERDRIER